MKNIGLIALVVLGLSGCALAPSIPVDYWGPQAKIEDSYFSYSNTKADVFFLDKIDGQKIWDIRHTATQASRGHGSAMTIRTIDRAVPAKQTTFHIVGRTYYVALIDQMFRTTYEVSGDVEFAPLPNHTYTVRGHIFDNGSEYDNYLAVWIQDDQTGEVVGKKIVLEGADSLNFFQRLGG
ncbi:MAG: hypothetical protein V4607_01320 [Pseudomonadota bacterium]